LVDEPANRGDGKPSRNKGNRLSDTEEQLRKLEEKVVRTFELIKQTQAEKLALQKDLEKLRMESREKAKVIDAHERELVTLRREREEVRIRIEKLLQRIDTLTTPESSE
jgi:chromosome segregation ATPase